MTKRIFRAVCIPAMAVLVASIVLIMGFLYEYFNGIRKSELRTELFLAAEAVTSGGIDYLESLNIDNCRITWIDVNGNVLFDNRTDNDKMENHLEREEVREAAKYGYGESERYSSTLTEKTLYCAKKLSDDSIIRVSVSQLTILTILLGIMQPIMVVLAIALVISFILASRLSKRIIEPLNNIDLDNPLENDTYEELGGLLGRIASQQRQISLQKNELIQKRNEFQAITSNMNEGLILLASDKKIISLNPAAEIFLIARTECIGKPFIELEKNADIIRAMQISEEHDSSELQMERNGRTFQVNISCIRDIEKISGFVILIFDVTDKVNAERSRREFTANVSHELKTPLQSIMGSAELIENGIVKKEDIPRFIGNIRKESGRLVTLIDDIIRLSRLDEGTDLPRQEFDLYELAEECIDRLKTSMDKHNVTVKLYGEHTAVSSVRPLVSEIIYNLVDNAIRYNKKNGMVDVTVSERKIIVKDTGIGIPEEHQERIFERFYRVDKSHSRETGGTGLGLSIVKHAAEDIGAKITLVSKVDEGTEITVLFGK